MVCKNVSTVETKSASVHWRKFKTDDFRRFLHQRSNGIALTCPIKTKISLYMLHSLDNSKLSVNVPKTRQWISNFRTYFALNVPLWQVRTLNTSSPTQYLNGMGQFIDFTLSKPNCWLFLCSCQGSVIITLHCVSGRHLTIKILANKSVRPTLVTGHRSLSRLYAFASFVLHFCWPVIMSVFIYLPAMAVNRWKERMEEVLAS